MTRRRKILDSFVFLWCQHQKVSNLFSLLFFFTPSLNRLNETKDYRISNSFLKNVRRMMDGGTKMDLTTKYKTRWCCWRLWIQRYICVTVLEKKRNRKKNKTPRNKQWFFLARMSTPSISNHRTYLSDQEYIWWILFLGYRKVYTITFTTKFNLNDRTMAEASVKYWRIYSIYFHQPNSFNIWYSLWIA